MWGGGSRSKRLETVALDFDVEDVRDEGSGIEVGEALAKLPDDLREAVELRYGSGLEVNEVARALGVSRFAVRRRINAALRLLEGELGEGGIDG